MKYSFTIGLRKGLVSALTAAATIIAILGFSDIVIWDFIEMHLKPFLAGLTVGGAIEMLRNYVKIKAEE